MNNVCRLLLLKNLISTFHRPLTFAEGAGMAVDRGPRFADNTLWMRSATTCISDG
jgi:hypothetical protein